MENESVTKIKIIQVSQKLFFTKGFHDTGIREIAEHAGISSGAIYKHFVNKEDILQAIFDPYVQAWWNVCNCEMKIFSENLKRFKNRKISFEELTKKDYTIFIDIFEKNKSEWMFIIHNSKGTKYEYFIDELVGMGISNYA